MYVDIFNSVVVVRKTLQKSCGVLVLDPTIDTRSFVRILEFRYGLVCVTTVSLFIKQWQQVMLEHRVRKLTTL